MSVSKVKLKRIALSVAAILCVAAFLLCALNAEDSFFSLSSNKRTVETDFVKFIDVGQGESVVIHSQGQAALLDTGPLESSLKLSQALLDNGISEIDVLMLSHLHIDHTGGVAQIFKDFNVQNLILPELSTYSEGIHSAQLAIDKVTRSGGQVHSAVQGMNFKVGNFEITVLAKYSLLEEENNRSLVIMAENRGKKFLFTGDIEVVAERKLLKEKLNLSCDVLKVGHHGSSTSSCPEFLDVAMPEFSVISCGEDNIYNHPHRETITALESRNSEIFRTDKQGDITFYIKNGEIIAETEK